MRLSSTLPLTIQSARAPTQASSDKIANLLLPLLLPTRTRRFPSCLRPAAPVSSDPSALPLYNQHLLLSQRCRRLSISCFAPNALFYQSTPPTSSEPAACGRTSLDLIAGIRIVSYLLVKQNALEARNTSIPTRDTLTTTTNKPLSCSVHGAQDWPSLDSEKLYSQQVIPAYLAGEEFKFLLVV